jgi:hypothetical protein
MPAMVGGFGNIYSNFLLNLKNITSSITFSNINNIKINNKQDHILESNIKTKNELLGSYLAGLIEGDGTFAVHNKDSLSKKYRPMIIIVFKLADLPLAEFLKNLTQCGTIYKKTDRGYII